jgi:hypothetical protein
MSNTQLLCPCSITLAQVAVSTAYTQSICGEACAGHADPKNGSVHDGDMGAGRVCRDLRRDLSLFLHDSSLFFHFTCTTTRKYLFMLNFSDVYNNTPKSLFANWISIDHPEIFAI